jgi:DnaJ-class molecular chaperone
VLARHALVEEGDYFEVLSLPRGASIDDVKKAHEGLMRELAPTSLDPALASELGAELRAIRVVLDEALRVLGEPRMRERYERHLPRAAEHAAG